MTDNTKDDKDLEERETAAAEKAAMSSRPDTATKKPDDWSML